MSIIKYTFFYMISFDKKPITENIIKEMQEVYIVNIFPTI